MHSRQAVTYSHSHTQHRTHSFHRRLTPHASRRMIRTRQEHDEYVTPEHKALGPSHYSLYKDSKCKMSVDSVNLTSLVPETCDWSGGESSIGLPF